MNGNKEKNQAANVPADAATVILVRQAEGGPEVYLMARESGAKVFAGAHVFPGGLLDAGDKDPGLLQGVDLPETHGMEGFWGNAAEAPEIIPALYFCAIRETFEEAGVLFASGAGNGSWKGVLRDRADLTQGKMSLAALVRQRSLRLLPDNLAPFARWITPETVRRRFDTRFFLARLPQGQEPAPDGAELSEGLWIRPAEALEAYEEGRLSLLPPTYMTLLALSATRGMDALLDSRKPREIRPVLPQPCLRDGQVRLLLPHDPDYSIPGFKQDPRPGEPSRVVMVDGRWRAAAL